VSLSTDPWIWIQALVVICVFSFLYRDNPVYASAQSFYVGCGAGHGIVLAWQRIQALIVVPFNQGQWIVWIPIVLSLMLLCRFHRRLNWLSRIAMAVPIGVGSGVALRAIPSSQILRQITASAANVFTVDGWIMIVGVISTIVFFLFTIGRENLLLRRIGYIGLGFMCVTFGVTFAGAILTYISIFFGPAANIFQSLLGIW
jgi:hypothetical protein